MQPPQRFEPDDPDFENRTRASFARQRFMDTLGARLRTVAPGQVSVEMAHQASLTQQHGFLHAGVVAAALDSACGYAAFTLMPADAAVLTVEFKVNLLRPARGPSFRFEARITKAGRTVSVCDAQAIQVDATGAEELIATMTATVMTVRGRDGLRQ